MFKRADASEESLSDGTQMCLRCSVRVGGMKAGNVSSRKTRRGIPNSAYKVSRDAVPSVFLKPDVKTNEERGTL